MGFEVKVIKTQVVAPTKPGHEHWLPLTNLDLVVPPIELGGFFCYKKLVDLTAKIHALKISLSQTLDLFYPLAGEIVHNAAGEPEIHCNNKGVNFIEAEADVNLRELDFYNHDDNIGGKLVPEKHGCGVLAVQVTILKCGGMVIACMFDHRIIDGYSINMFTSSWADMTLSRTPSFLPNFRRSDLNPRHPRVYTPKVANMFIPLSLPSLQTDSLNESKLDQDPLINRIYYMEGDQINRLQLLASENGYRMSKIEAFTSFLWKIMASYLEDSGHFGYMCNIVVPIDGRRRLSEGEGIEKEKLMAARCGNFFSMPFRGIRSKDLKDMSLSSVANEVHELFESASTKEHFKELIDWVEDQRRPRTLISRPFAIKEKAISLMVSSGLRFSLIGNMDFGWGKPVFLSCHVPTTRADCHVMPMVSPINEDDWIVYMHLPKKLLNYIEARASQLSKPLTTHYLKLVLNTCVPRM